MAPSAGRATERIIDASRSSQVVRPPYAVVPWSLAQDMTISMAARGLLVHLLSLPDGWTLNIRRLAEQTKEGRTALESAYRELRSAGYLRVVKVRDDNGRITSRSQWRADLNQPWPDGDDALFPPPETRISGPGKSTDREPGFPARGEPGALREQRGRDNTDLTVSASTDQEARTVNVRAQELARGYCERVPLSRFVAVMGITKKAVQTDLYSDEQIAAALARIAASGRPLTVDVLRVELEGLAPPPARPRSDKLAPIERGLALARSAQFPSTDERKAIGG